MNKFLLLTTLLSGTAFAQQPCQVGDVLYQDKSCSSVVDSTKIPIAVVLDSNKKLAISLNQSYKYWTIQASSLEISIPGGFITDSSLAIQQFDGRALVAPLLAIAPNFYQAASYCNNMSVNASGFGLGQWYLPALGELNLMYQNLSALNNALGQIQNADTFNNNYYWSSSEYSFSQAWQQYFQTGAVYYDNNNSKSYARCVVQY